MNPRVIAVCCSLAVGCGAASTPDTVSNEACPAQWELRGRVVAEDTSSAVSSASIVASGYERHGRGFWERTGVTDDDGVFRVCVPGTDQVEVSTGHPDFGLQWTSRDWYGHRYFGPLPDRPIRLELRRGAVLRGRLCDADGHPLPDRVVMVFLPMIAQVCMTGVCRHVRAVTDGNGELRFERMLLSPDMRPGWSLPDLPAWQFGSLAEENMAAYVAAAEAGQSVDLVVASPSDLDEEFREIMEETANEHPESTE